MKTFGLDDRIIRDIKSVKYSSNTMDGIRLLGLPLHYEYNFAGNTYLLALRSIEKLLKILNEE